MNPDSESPSHRFFARTPQNVGLSLRTEEEQENGPRSRGPGRDFLVVVE